MTLVRNATVLLELDGHRVLIDPALDEAGARPPVQGTENRRPNPLVPLPFRAEDLVRGLDAVLVTHLHRDHLDDAGERLLPRDVPLFCQPSDEERLRALGFDAHPVVDELEWRGILIRRASGRHTLDPLVEADLGPVSGFVFEGIYIASDSVWCPEIEEAIERWRPHAAVVNAGAARFVSSGLISMDVPDIREVAARVPIVMAVHLEAMNHCPLTRAELRTALPNVLVPEDGETCELW